MIHQLFLKSIGFGVHLVEIISKDGSKAGFDQFLELIRSSGIEANQVTFDPSTKERAVILSNTGMVPSKYEVGQITDEDWEFLNLLRPDDTELDERLKLIEKIKRVV